MKISERIKEYRKTNNLTQSELATKLFVSKQAVSKWENDNGYPDISLYPKLAEMFGVSIDELMGVEKPTNSKKSKVWIISSICLLVLLLIGTIITVVLLTDDQMNNNDDDNQQLLQELINKTENNLDLSLPDITTWEYVNTEGMHYLNTWYPDSTYYFIFNENDKLESFQNLLSSNERWIPNIDNEIKVILPDNAVPYIYNCQFFQLVCTTNGMINALPNTAGKYQMEFYCYQKETNRLIVTVFNYEVK